MASKVVSQRIQNTVKADIARLLDESPEYESYSVDKETGTIIVNDEYEVLMVVIPKQSINHSEVRNG